MTKAQQDEPVSVFIVTKNEARYIAQVLHSVRSFDEVIVVDSGSTDNTTTIAKQHGAKVVHHRWQGFAKQKAYAMSLCKNNWVLNLDGDEVLPAELAEEIQESINSGEAEAYRLYFEDIFWGKPMASNSKKRSIIRLYLKDRIQFPINRHVHENVILSDGVRVKSLNGLVTHYGYATTEMLMTKQNTYSSLKALEKHEQGKRGSLLKLMVIFPLTFTKSFFFRKMFLSGRRGLVNATIDAFYAFLKEAKLLELTYLK